MAEEHVLRKRIVKQSPSASDYGFPFSVHVVCKRQPRRKVIQVLSVKLACTHIVATACGIKRPHLPIFFTRNAKIIPAQAVVERQSGAHSEAVLDVKPMAVLVSVPQRIARHLRPITGSAAQECSQIVEVERPPKVMVDHLHDRGSSEFVSPLQGMLTRLHAL